MATTTLQVVALFVSRVDLALVDLADVTAGSDSAKAKFQREVGLMLKLTSHWKSDE